MKKINNIPQQNHNKRAGNSFCLPLRKHEIKENNSFNAGSCWILT